MESPEDIRNNGKNELETGLEENQEKNFEQDKNVKDEIEIKEETLDINEEYSEVIEIKDKTVKIMEEDVENAQPIEEIFVSDGIKKYMEEDSTLQERREKEPDSDLERFFTQLSVSEFPLVVVERLSFKDLKIYFEGVLNYSDFKEYLMQVKDEENGISGEFSDQRKLASRNYASSAINLGILNKRSKEKNCISNTKNPYLKLYQVMPFRCPECGYECNAKQHFKYHLLTHTKIKLFKCLHCNYSSNCKYTIKKHMLLHTENDLFFCVDCSYSCKVKYELRRHMLRHSKKKLFKCSDCNYECNFRRLLNSHMLRHKESAHYNHRP